MSIDAFCFISCDTNYILIIAFFIEITVVNSQRFPTNHLSEILSVRHKFNSAIFNKFFLTFLYCHCFVFCKESCMTFLLINILALYRTFQLKLFNKFNTIDTTLSDNLMLKAPLTLDITLQIFIKLLAIDYPGFVRLSQVIDLEVKFLLNCWLGSDMALKLSF